MLPCNSRMIPENEFSHKSKAKTEQNFLNPTSLSEPISNPANEEKNQEFQRFGPNVNYFSKAKVTFLSI